MIDPHKPLPPGVAEALADKEEATALHIPPAPVANQTVAKQPVFHFLDTGKTRCAEFELEHPVVLGDRAFRKIQMKRLTVGELGEHRERMRKLQEVDPNATVPLPIFVDEDGRVLPDGFFDALDLDDSDRMDEAAAGFLPRRFQADPNAERPNAGLPVSGSGSSGTALAEAMDGHATT